MHHSSTDFPLIKQQNVEGDYTQLLWQDLDSKGGEGASREVEGVLGHMRVTIQRRRCQPLIHALQLRLLLCRPQANVTH
eukprot:m.281674 g.281674  ORF g.281674 m.281674 type:complete len:79 (-) comp15753_c0_seq12:2121-2357(-)